MRIISKETTYSSKLTFLSNFEFFHLFQCNFSDALFAYERALQVSVQREVRLLCLHEVGWSYVLLLQWQNAANAFLQLKRDSRWSKSFYCYLSSGLSVLHHFI